MEIRGPSPHPTGRSLPQGPAAARPQEPERTAVETEPTPQARPRAAWIQPNQFSFGQEPDAETLPSSAHAQWPDTACETMLSLQNREAAQRVLAHLNQWLGPLEADGPPSAQQQCASCLIAGSLWQRGPQALGDLLKASVPSPPSPEAKALYQQLQTREITPSQLQQLHAGVGQDLLDYANGQSLTPQLLQDYIQARRLEALADLRLGLLYTETLGLEVFVASFPTGELFRAVPETVSAEQLQAKRGR